MNPSRSWRTYQLASGSRIIGSSGSPAAHSAMAMGKRGWKTHPAGGLAGLGGSPGSTTRSRSASAMGSGSGMADSSACV